MHEQVENNSNSNSEGLGRVSTGDGVRMHAEAWFAPSKNNSFFDDHHNNNDAQQGGASRNRTQDEPAAAAAAAASILSERRNRRLRIASVALRGATAVLCFLSMIIMAANADNGDIKLHNVQSFVYLVVVVVVALAYSLLQLGRLCLELRRSRPAEPWQVWCAADFSLDQLCAYLLMSGASAAASASTGLMQNVGVDSFTQMGAASVAMAFLAFFVSAASAAVSAFNFAKLINWG